ncbi:MAG: Ig-like domain-containing protein, partial [Gammaproteobacteria bacterium]
SCGGRTITYSRTIQIGDTTPPSITSISPGNGDTNVATDTIITVEFSDDMNPATFITNDPPDTTADSVLLRVSGTTNYITLSTSYDPIQRSLAITPSALSNDTAYVLTLTDTIADDGGNVILENNALINEVEVTFRTAPLP